MKTKRSQHPNPYFSAGKLLRIGIFAALVAIVAVPLYTASSASFSRKSDASKSNKTGTAPANALALFVPQAAAPSIATFAAGCVTPQTDFVLGEIVCAHVTGGTSLPRRLTFVDPSGFIRQVTNITSDPQDISFQIPLTETSDVGTPGNPVIVDNRGKWRVNMISSRATVVTSTAFIVSNPANRAADVSVTKSNLAANQQVSPGATSTFQIFVANNGPDNAANVVLTDVLPSNTTFFAITQSSGPAFTCTAPDQGSAGTVTCTIASLAGGDTAGFDLAYTVNAGTANNTVISNTAGVTSDTADPDSSNNNSTATATVVTSGGGGGCTLTCPDDITANADTTEGGQRGAHVTYSDPTTTGTCGTVTSSPASGSFFPVGTTIVNSTSDTGDASCSFAVTVEDSNGNVSITCPANQTASADNDCSATVNIGTATGTGANVTFFATRSDGQPVYNCDVNGNCTRVGSDAPFSAGTTTITWFAYSHDAAGPYTTPGLSNPTGDTFEEQHRTGTASCQQTVTVNDTTPPVITATDSSASADANCQAPIPDYSNAVTDNCACASNDNSQDCVGQHRITTTQNPAAGTLVGPGPHTVHITANDGSSNNGGAGNTTTKDVTFTVNDTTPPVITCPPNQSNVPTEPGTCAAHVTTGTATATDNCDSTPTITASRSDGRPLTDTYPKGTTTITWTATDDAGNQSSCQQTITVVDNEPPVIVLNGQTPSMWPPNHKYQTFAVTNFVTSVTDNCDSIAVSSVVITKVTSDEIENGNGDGNTTNDIVIAANCKSIQLRSEREGNGDGRVYTIYFKVVDSSGNVGTATAKVVVQHNPGETAVDSGTHYTVTSNCP